jgi:hypothetical protein
MDSITIVKEFTHGQTSVEGEPDLCHWKTYLTDKENIILIRAFLKDGISEVTYDGTKEKFMDALNRAISKNKSLA